MLLLGIGSPFPARAQGHGPGGGPYAANVAIKHTRYLNCSILSHRQFLAATPMARVYATHTRSPRQTPPRPRSG